MADCDHSEGHRVAREFEPQSGRDGSAARWGKGEGGDATQKINIGGPPQTHISQSVAGLGQPRATLERVKSGGVRRDCGEGDRHVVVQAWACCAVNCPTAWIVHLHLSTVVE